MRLFLFITALAFGTAPAAHAQVPGAADSLRAQAARMVNGLKSGDYTTFLHYLHPKVVEMAGGADNLKNALQQMTQQLSTAGMSFQSITIDSLSDFIKTGTELQATLRQHTAVKMPDGRSVATSTLIGISADNGKHWKFVDTHNKTLADMRQAMPNLSSRLVIPPTLAPVHFDH